MEPAAREAAAKGDDQVFELARDPTRLRELRAGNGRDLAGDCLDERLAAEGMIRNPKKIGATLRNARDLQARSRQVRSACAHLRSFGGDAEALVRDSTPGRTTSVHRRSTGSCG